MVEKHLKPFFGETKIKDITFNDVEGELLAELLPDLQDFEFSDELKKYNERYTSFYNWAEKTFKPIATMCKVL